jgi:hypothetical protein
MADQPDCERARRADMRSDMGFSSAGHADRVMGEGVLGPLSAEGSPCHVESNESGPGLDSAGSDCVPAEPAGHARVAPGRSPVSDAQVTGLASPASPRKSQDE